MNLFVARLQIAVRDIAKKSSSVFENPCLGGNVLPSIHRFAGGSAASVHRPVGVSPWPKSVGMPLVRHFVKFFSLFLSLSLLRISSSRRRRAPSSRRECLQVLRFLFLPCVCMCVYYLSEMKRAHVSKLVTPR